MKIFKLHRQRPRIAYYAYSPRVLAKVDHQRKDQPNRIVYFLEGRNAWQQGGSSKQGQLKGEITNNGGPNGTSWRKTVWETRQHARPKEVRRRQDTMPAQKEILKGEWDKLGRQSRIDKCRPVCNFGNREPCCLRSKNPVTVSSIWRKINYSQYMDVALSSASGSESWQAQQISKPSTSLNAIQSWIYFLNAEAELIGSTSIWTTLQSSGVLTKKRSYH